VWTGSARARDYAEEKVSRSPGLGEPFGVAVDRVGDLFVADHQNSRVLVLAPGGSPQALPFTGLDRPTGVAVDETGDVFVADGPSVFELRQFVNWGSLAVAPGNGPAGSQIAVAGATPCPLGGAFSSTSVMYTLYSPAGAVVQSTTSTIDLASNWSGR
jgi:NHL repeat